MIAISSLLGWWLSVYFVKAIHKNVFVCLGVFLAIMIALSFACRMFWYLGCLSDLWVLMLRLYRSDSMVPTI